MASAQGSIAISLSTARGLAVVKQGLHRRPQDDHGQSLLDTIRRIGLLQIDAINVVARSHYLVLLSRVGIYRPDDLDVLVYPRRRLFEQWAHAACLIPSEHYAYFHPIILHKREQSHGRQERLGPESLNVLRTVMDEIRRRGPLSSKDFEDPRGKRGTWWDWKPAKHALEILFEQGYLMVDRREGFRRYYDLSERVLPQIGATSSHTLAAWRRWAILQSVKCLGVATAGQISDYYRLKTVDVRSEMGELVKEGALVPVEVEGWGEIAYMDPSDLHALEEVDTGVCRPVVTTFLSPFDNLIWDRARVLDLFGFDYRLEAYTPPAKRQYGYYVMPILHHGRLVGRLDPKAGRRDRTMMIRSLHLEPGETLTDELVVGLAGALREFMVFHGSQSLFIEHSNSEPLREALLRRVSSE